MGIKCLLDRLKNMAVFKIWRSFRENIKTGLTVYQKLKISYGTECKIKVLYSGTGDAYLVGTRYHAYLSYLGEEDTALLVVAGTSAQKVVQLFGISPVIALKNREILEIIKLYVFCGDLTDISILHPHIFFRHTGFLAYLEGVREELNFRGMMEHIIFDPVLDCAPTQPKFESGQKYIQMLQNEMGIKRGRSVLLVPDSVTVKPLPKVFWERLIAKLKADGFDVYVNSNQNRRLRGAKELMIPYQFLVPVLDYFGFFVIGIRCGLFDVIHTTTGYMVVYYNAEDKKRGCAQTMDLMRSFSLKRMFGVSNVEEYIVSAENSGQIIQKTAALLCEERFRRRVMAGDDMRFVMGNANCTGCGACFNICPVQAIQMIYDKEGYLKPSINFEKCLHCGKCEQSCPVLQEKENKNWENPRCFAVHADDNIRGSSTSGGVFYLLARKILENGGVVYGAAFTPDFYVKHKAIYKVEDLHQICHTKYVQSDVNTTFTEAKNFLEQGRTVLYSGCSCQIAGLKAYLEKSYPNLFLVDILCMQVPPVTLFRRYLDETYGGIDNVERVVFRDKRFGWTSKNMTVTVRKKVDTLSDYPLGWLTESKTEETDGKVVYNRDVRYDPYLQIFYHKLTMNHVCANCKFATFPRQGDLSLGDFWNICAQDAAFNDNNGVSLVLVNNTKGQNLLDTVKHLFIKQAEEPLEYIGKNRVQGELPLYGKREQLFSMLRSSSIEKAVKYCMDNHYDVGIVGAWTNENYGGSLTYYALYHVLVDMGLSVQLISQPFTHRSWDSVLNTMRYDAFPYPSYSFAPAPQNVQGLKKYNKMCDTFVVGSDQLFNFHLYYNTHRFVDLSWAYDNKRKIAYAASFGTENYNGPEQERARLQYFLQKFDFFSVREDTGVKIASTQFARSADLVLDPVFLCEREHYDQLVRECRGAVPETPYLFTYMLDISPEREKFLKAVAQRLGLPITAITDACTTQKAEWDISVIQGASNNQFLSCIKHAQFVVTDSFHGMCFCIIFQVPFLVILNSKRGGSRMTSLLQRLSLESRLISENDLIDLKGSMLTPIDYGTVSQKLNAEIERSFAWLKHALYADIGSKALSEYNILDQRMDEEISKLRRAGFSTHERKSKLLLQRGIRCLKENGMKYTIKRFFEKVQHKLIGRPRAE